MAIGTATAILAGASLAGSALSSSSASRAAREQAAAITAGNDAATAEQRRQFDITQSYFDPIYRDSRAAASVYNAALGIPGMTGGATPAPGAPGSSGLYDYTNYVESNPDLKAEFGRVGGQFGGDEAAYGRYHWGQFGQAEGRPVPTMTGGGSPGAASGATSTAPLTQASIASMVQQTPGYQAQLDSGLKAIDRAAPLRGGMYSGRRMKALESEGQKTFGSYYDNWLNRIGGVAGQQTGTAGAITSAGQNAANNVSSLMASSAAARGDAKVNSANAWSNGLNNLMTTGAYMYGAR